MLRVSLIGDFGVARAALALLRTSTWRAGRNMIILERWDALDNSMRQMGPVSQSKIP